MNKMRQIRGFTFMVWLWSAASVRVEAEAERYCQEQSSLQLVSTEQSFVETEFNIVGVVVSTAKLFKALNELPYSDAVNPAFFCSQSARQALVIGGPVQFSDKALGTFEFRAGERILHDCVALRLNLNSGDTGGREPRAAGDTEAQPGVTSTPSTRSVDPEGGSGAGEEESEEQGEDQIQERPLTEQHWSYNSQLLCVIDQTATSGSDCYTVLTDSIAGVGKPFPGMRTLEDEKISFMVEDRTGFSWESVMDEAEDAEEEDQDTAQDWKVETEGERNVCVLSKMNPIYDNIRRLREAAGELLGQMIRRYELFNQYLSKRVEELPGCASFAITTLSCQVLEKDCSENLSAQEKIDIQNVCGYFNRFSRRRGSRNPVTQILFYDSLSTLDNLARSQNIIRLNQQSLSRNIEMMNNYFGHKYKNLVSLVDEVANHYNDLAFRIWLASAFSELKLFQVNYGFAKAEINGLIRQQAGELKWLARSFDNQIKDLLGALRSDQQACTYDGDGEYRCRSSPGLLAGTADNRLTVTGIAERLDLRRFSLVLCLPVAGRISKLSGRLWLRDDSNGEYQLGEDVVPLKCSQNEDLESDECEQFLKSITEEREGLPPLMFAGAPFRYLLKTGGVIINTEYDEIAVLTSRGGQALKINGTPTFLSWSQFPVAFGSLKARKRNLMVRAASRDTITNFLLAGYRPRDYKMHLSNNPLKPNYVLELEEAGGGELTLIKMLENKVELQVFSGISLFLFLLVMIFIIYCLCKRKRCRQLCETFFCCLCKLADLGTAGAKKEISNQNARLGRAWRAYNEQPGEEEVEMIAPGAPMEEESVLSPSVQPNSGSGEGERRKKRRQSKTPRVTIEV